MAVPVPLQSVAFFFPIGMRWNDGVHSAIAFVLRGNHGVHSAIAFVVRLNDGVQSAIAFVLS